MFFRQIVACFDLILEESTHRGELLKKNDTREKYSQESICST